MPAHDTGLAFCGDCARKLANQILTRHEARQLWCVALPVGPLRPEELSSENAEAHADLAIAYLEMAMLSDALRAALVAMTTGEAPAIVAALAVVFSPELFVGKAADVLALVMPS